MTDKLNNNDRQRIERETEKRYTNDNFGRYDFKRGAEYGTTYEREQQANGLKSIENPDHHIKVLKEQIQRMEKEYKQLEAERSELIEYNNNLEKTLRICLTVKPHTESVDAMKAMVKTLLENSLKTK